MDEKGRRRMYLGIWSLALIVANLLFAGALAWLNGRVVELRAIVAPVPPARPPLLAARKPEAPRIQPLGIEGLVRYEKHITEAARRYGVDPNLVKAIIAAESAGQPWAVSPKDARGLMQIMPSTGRDLGVRRTEHLFDPRVNIHLGTRYFAQLIQLCRGRVSCALAAYNAGPGVLTDDRPLPAETRAYIPRVYRYWAKFRTSRQRGVS
jgi:soluble lytic murein transglycosylase-like protein